MKKISIANDFIPIFEYDLLIRNKAFLESVARGISDAESGNLYSSEEIRDEITRRRTL